METGGKYITLVAMNDKKRKELVAVKIEKKIVDMVREHKRGTFIPISIFFGVAAMEKLEKEKPVKKK